MMSEGNDRFYPLSDETRSLSPEEKLLWWMLHQSSKNLKLGLTSKRKSDIIEALDCHIWFFRKGGKIKSHELRFSDFVSVCKTLNVDARRIRKAIEVNPEFPTRAHLEQKLANVSRDKRIRRRKAKKCQ